MRKSTLLGTVAAAAIMVFAASDAFACSGNSCTPVNSVVTGKAVANGAAFEKAGIAAVGTDNAQVAIGGVAGSKSTATLQRDVDCVSGCITGSATTLNYAGYAAEGTGDVVVSGGIAGTHGTTGVELTSVGNNHEGETALATVHTGATAGTLVGSFDIGFGSGGVTGETFTGVSSAAEACAKVLENHSSAYADGASAYNNSGNATGLLAGAGSYGLTGTTTGVATTALDGTVVNTTCILGQCNKDTPISGLVATGGVAGTVAGAGSLDGDLALNGTATTGSTGFSYGVSTLASNVDLDKTYGKIGETKSIEYTGGHKWGILNPKNWTKVVTPINGVNGLTGTAQTDATVAAGAGATGDLVGAFAAEEKEVGSSVTILTVGGQN